jgi:UDP-2,3-diacylglucosamine hydrolase
MARAIQKKGRRHSVENAITDVTEEAVAIWLKQYQSTILIHGHTHRPAKHVYKDYTRWVLPDWSERHNGYLYIDQTGITMRTLQHRLIAE